MASSQPGYFNLQGFTDAGALLVGGRLYTYSYGTTTQKTAYTDAAGTIPHTYTSDGAGGQYIALNSRGELPAPLYLATGSYDLALKRADGSSVWTRRADPQAASVDPANLSNTANFALGVALVGGASRVIDSIAVLRTLPKTGSTRVFVTGYYAAGDGGGGPYYYDASDTTSADNGGTIIVASDSGRWKLSLTSPQVSVDQFGAIGDLGVTDNTTAFTACMTWLNSVGGGVALVGNKVYGFGSTGTLTVPAKVELTGVVEGPFDGSSAPSATVWGPTLLVKATATTFLTLGGEGASCANLLFYYPNQVAPTATTPTVYPFCISASQGTNGATARKIRRCTIVNAYQGIDIQIGRTFVQDCLIGAFANDINIDHAADWVWLDRVHGQVLWDFFTGTAFPSAIDAWVMNNSTFLKTARVDSLQASNIGFFWRYTGHQAVDSTDVALSPRNGYGRFVNFDMDSCAYGINAISTNAGAQGFKYVNLELGANGTGTGTAGQASVILQAGGLATPVLSIIGGGVRGSWAAGAQHVTGLTNGTVYTDQWRGFNPYGSIAAPAVAATGVAVKNPYPFRCRVAIANGTGTLSGVAINGSGAGVTQGMYGLEVNETITLTYGGGTVTWSWFGS